ncbi:helix-turn-helix transcriptional regulator [Corallococcus interemptor]|uniref:helix-turn-helix transcriptional regulator n=1 Tax=Corallococcus interemptor TaxID=2316720 RepID=UPI003D051CEF
MAVVLEGWDGVAQPALEALQSMYSIRGSEAPGVVRGIGLYRGRSERPFDEADRELLHLFHAECGALLDPPEPTEEKAPDVRLAPRERQTLELLLQGLGDKQIAARLGISRFTVNQYTKTLYRRFGVQSRTALIARVLGQQGGGTGFVVRLPAS